MRLASRPRYHFSHLAYLRFDVLGGPLAHHEFEVNGSPSSQRVRDAVAAKWSDLPSNEISCLLALLRLPVSPSRFRAEGVSKPEKTPF